MKNKLLFIFGLFFFFLKIVAPANAQDLWQVDEIVGLHKGMCIREGPGLNYRAHTVVPENEWLVKVIDGPRYADGKTWYDTSRYLAGDPSGGTGWVAVDQSDTNCSNPSITQSDEESNGISTIQPPMKDLNMNSPIPDYWKIFVNAWITLPYSVKIITFLLIILFLLALWRFIGNHIFNLIGNIFLAVLIYFAMDLTQGIWWDWWQGFGRDIFQTAPPNLALLLASLPLVSWLIQLILGILKRTTLS